MSNLLKEHGLIGGSTADLTNLVPEVLKVGVDVNGIIGTFTNDANAVNADIATGKTAWVNGVKRIGTSTAKKFATGIAVSSPSMIDFININNSTQSLYSIDITNLNFTPSIIIVFFKQPNMLRSTLYFKTNTTENLYTHPVQVNTHSTGEYSTTNYHIKGDVGNCVITSSLIRLPVLYFSANHRWMAVE